MPDLVEHALAYAAAGLEIFPCGPNKAPLTTHGMKDATSNPTTIEAWWRQLPTALIGCRIPAELVVLDIDPRHGGLETWLTLKAGHPTIETRAHYSGRKDGGGHIWFKRPDGKLTGKQLAAWAREHGTGEQTDHGWLSGIDLLAHNMRYTILPPSPHPETGQPYEWAHGHGIDHEAALCPLWLASYLVEAPAADKPELAYRTPTATLDGSVADWYCDQARWSEILTGWQITQGDGEQDGSQWRHPAATAPWSATIRHGQLFVYSTNTPFEPTTVEAPAGYTKFRANAILNHHGDLKAAARWIGRERDGPPVDIRKLAPEPFPKPPGQERISEPAGRRIKLVPASSIAPLPTNWLWQDRIPQGALTLLGGREGIGKSTYAYDLAADITRGKVPGVYHGQPKPVIVAATEDSWAHTIVPRLMAAGANLDTVYRIDVVTSEGDEAVLSLPEDMAGLARAVTENNVGLILLDPLMSRLNVKLDTHKDGDVRQALEPLTRLADQTGAAMLGLIHVNKSSSGDPLTMLMGSRAFAAVARAVLFIMVDPESEGLRLLGQAKNNLGRSDLPTLRFGIENTLVAHTAEGDIYTGKLCWEGESPLTIQDAIDVASRSSEEKGETESAAEWLQEYLASRHGAELADTVKTEAKRAGHELRTLQRAKKQLGVEHVKLEFAGKTYWKLKNAVIVAPKDNGAKPLGRHEHGAVVVVGADTPINTIAPTAPNPTRKGALAIGDLI